MNELDEAIDSMSNVIAEYKKHKETLLKRDGKILLSTIKNSNFLQKTSLENLVLSLKATGKIPEDVLDYLYKNYDELIIEE